MDIGTEWLVDAQGCDPDALRDLEVILGICNRIVSDLELRVVGEPSTHQFPAPGGVTTLFLLTESHLTCHTYPESGIATFNLYCCRSRPEWAWADGLREWLGAATVTIRREIRGAYTSEYQVATEAGADVSRNTGHDSRSPEGATGVSDRSGESRAAVSVLLENRGGKR